MPIAGWCGNDRLPAVVSSVGHWQWESMMDLDEILLTADEAMQKATDYLKHELHGIRTGRASGAMVEYVKVDYYGSPTDLRQLALISVPSGPKKRSSFRSKISKRSVRSLIGLPKRWS